MSTNVPINCMTVTSMPLATIPLVPIDAPAIPGTKETEQAAIFVSLTNIEIQVTSVCYDTRISHSLSFCIVIWNLQFWKYIFLTWVGPESRPRWNSSWKRAALLYSIASVQIFSSLFSIPTIWYCQGNLFDNQELSFIPIILMFDSAVIGWGENKCQSLLGV